MSRWAETFAALSRGNDTTDTSDTRSETRPQVEPSVACVETVVTIGGGHSWAPKPAEMLEVERLAEPSVPCVTSVVDRKDQEARLAASPPPGAYDTSATLATKGDNPENARGNERNEENEIIPPRGPESGLNSLNSFVSFPERIADEPDLGERATLIEYGANVPKSRAEGYAALSSMPVPTGFSPERWCRIVDAAGVFIDRWAAVAIERGWSDLDVFGCNPDRPDARFDAMGLVLLLDRCEIIGIDEDGADLLTATGDKQRYRRRPLPADTVSLWALSRP